MHGLSRFFVDFVEVFDDYERANEKEREEVGSLSDVQICKLDQLLFAMLGVPQITQISGI